MPLEFLKGGFPVMAEITRILAANIRRQFFFVITTAAGSRCLVQNFQLLCYSQRVNATSQYNELAMWKSKSSRLSYSLVESLPPHKYLMPVMIDFFLISWRSRCAKQSGCRVIKPQVAVQHVQNGPTIGCLQWWNIAGSLYKEEEAAEKDD